MNNMIMLKLGPHEQVADDPRIWGNFNANRVIDCPHRGQSMCVRSDAAGALYKMVGIPRVSALQDDLNAPKHLSRAPGVDNLATGHFDFDSKVALNSGNWIYRYSLCHMIPPFFAG